MKRNSILSLLIAFYAVIVMSVSVLAINVNNEDTDTRIVDAEVVEVAQNHVSVLARSGVEHVIAINSKNTKVTVEGIAVSLKDLHQGDVITVELDADHPMKLAKNIKVMLNGTQLARARK
jgi:hypothetical protein